MPELNDFYNKGFGWICRHCERELESSLNTSPKHSRLLSEGESEGRNPTYSNIALAKWADPARRTLICPTCGITELADKS